MGRSPCCSKQGLNRGPWTSQEDKILFDYIKSNGEGRWRNIPKLAGLKRCGKSCRLRWLNYLRPNIKRGNITQDEEDLIVRLHRLLGNRWSLIAGRIPGRTDNEIKNYWNSNLCKKSQCDDDDQNPSGNLPCVPSNEAPECPPVQSNVEDKLYNDSNCWGNLWMEDFYMREMSLSEFLETDFTKLSNVFGEKVHMDFGDDFGSQQLADFRDLADEWIM